MTMSKVCTFDRKNSARKLSSISAEPNSVKRKNLIDAYSRFGPPHTPIMKNIGSSTTSKKMKKRIRSWATNVPFMPDLEEQHQRQERPSGCAARGSGSTSR